MKTILSLHEKNENYVERHKNTQKELSTRNLQHFVGLQNLVVKPKMLKMSPNRSIAR